jgi:hypothetical protein
VFGLNKDNIDLDNIDLDNIEKRRKSLLYSINTLEKIYKKQIDILK